MAQTSLDDFLECLSTWEIFLDIIKVQDELNSNFKSQYYDVVAPFAQELITECQFRTNFDKLSKLDNPKDTEDPEENDLRKYLTSCLDTLSLAVSLYPSELLALILPGLLSSIQQVIEGNLHLAMQSNSEEVYYSVLDTGTILRLSGAVSEPFLTHFQFYFEGGVTLMKS